MKTIDAHFLFQPLECNFQVVESGGTNVQKFNGTDGTFIPDRTITPYILRPQLAIHDPDGQIDDGDKTSLLVNSKWFLNGVQIISGQNGYTINSYGQLTIAANSNVDVSTILEYTCQFLDPRRNDVLQFSYKTTLSCLSSKEYNLFLDLDASSKTLISVFKMRDQTVLNAQLRNGLVTISDDKATYQWQVFDNDVWRNVDPTQDWWYISGEYTKSLILQSEYIQNLLIRCVAYANAYPDVIKYASTRLVRYFGIYEEFLDIVKGQYLINSTPGSEVHGGVTNRQGNITNPCKYFDIAIFFAPNFVEKKWRKLSSDTEAYISKKDMNIDYSAKPTFAIEVKEKSAYVPLTFGDKALTVGGSVILIQVPKDKLSQL